MESKTKRQLLIWAVAILVIVNIASLGTIWYHKISDRARWHERSDYSEKMARKRMSNKADFKRQWAEKMHKSLNLEDQQAMDFDSIWSYYSEERKANFRKMGDLKRILDKELTREVLNQDTIDLLLQQQTDLFKAGNDQIVEMNMALRDILTEEQRVKYSSYMEKIQKRRGQ